MAVLETLYSGDDVLLIFPDGTGPGESVSTQTSNHLDSMNVIIKSCI